MGPNCHVDSQAADPVAKSKRDVALEIEPPFTRRTSGGKTSRSFPLPPDFFPRVQMTNDMNNDELVARTEDALQLALARANWHMVTEYENYGWKRSSKKRQFQETGLRLYSRKLRHRRKLEFRALGRVPLTVDQVMDVCYADNTIDYRRKLTALLDNLIDAAVLHVAQRHSDDENRDSRCRYLGINWVAVHNRGFLRKKRDFCFLLSTGIVIDEDQQRVGYVSIQPIEVEECRSMEKTHGLLRTNMSATLLIREMPDHPSCSQLLWLGDVELASNSTSSSSLLSLVKNSFTSILRGLHAILDVKCFARQTEVRRADWVPDEHRKFCYLCCKRFSLLRARHHCRACGEVMCSACEFSQGSTTVERVTDLDASTCRGRDRKRYCKKCMIAVREDVMKAGAPRSDPVVLFEPSHADYLGQSNVSEPVTSDSNGRTSDVSSPGSRWCHSEGSPSSFQFRSHSRKDKDGERDFKMSWSKQLLLPDSPIAAQRSLSTRTADFSVDYSTRENSMKGERPSDLAARLWEISCKAQEALETTRRNSCIMSDGGSSTRPSTDTGFQHLDKSIAEQAELLNVIGLVSTGRVYMEQRESEAGGVRMSHSSSRDTDRFEVINE